jgi:hypothetical protein
VNLDLPQSELLDRFGNYGHFACGGVRRKVRLRKDAICEIHLIVGLGKFQELGFSEETSLL